MSATSHGWLLKLSNRNQFKLKLQSLSHAGHISWVQEPPVATGLDNGDGGHLHHRRKWTQEGTEARVMLSKQGVRPWPQGPHTGCRTPRNKGPHEILTETFLPLFPIFFTSVLKCHVKFQAHTLCKKIGFGEISTHTDSKSI